MITTTSFLTSYLTASSIGSLVFNISSILFAAKFSAVDNVLESFFLGSSFTVFSKVGSLFYSFSNGNPNILVLGTDFAKLRLGSIFSFVLLWLGVGG